MVNFFWTIGILFQRNITTAIKFVLEVKPSWQDFLNKKIKFKKKKNLFKKKKKTKVFYDSSFQALEGCL